jgi:hypothetical protein
LARTVRAIATTAVDVAAGGGRTTRGGTVRSRCLGTDQSGRAVTAGTGGTLFKGIQFAAIRRISSGISRLAVTVKATDRVDADGIGPARRATPGALVHIDAVPSRSSVPRLTGARVASVRIEAVFIGCTRARGAFVDIDATPRGCGGHVPCIALACVGPLGVGTGTFGSAHSTQTFVDICAKHCGGISRVTAVAGARKAPRRVGTDGIVPARRTSSTFVDVDTSAIFRLISRMAIAIKASGCIDAIAIRPARIAGCALVDVCASSRRIALVAIVARTRVPRSLANGIGTARRVHILNALARRTIGTGKVEVAGCMLAKRLAQAATASFDRVPVKD